MVDLVQQGVQHFFHRVIFQMFDADADGPAAVIVTAQRVFRKVRTAHRDRTGQAQIIHLDVADRLHRVDALGRGKVLPDLGLQLQHLTDIRGNGLCLRFIHGRCLCFYCGGKQLPFQKRMPPYAADQTDTGRDCRTHHQVLPAGGPCPETAAREPPAPEHHGGKAHCQHSRRHQDQQDACAEGLCVCQHRV